MLMRPIGTKPAASMRCTTGAFALAAGRVGQHARAGRRRLAGDVEQVLQRDRNAGVAARRPPRCAQRVHRVRHGARLVGVDLDEGARALAGGIGDARQAFLDQCAAGRAAVGQGLGEFVDPAHDAASRVPMRRMHMTDTPAKPVLLTGASGALGRVLAKSLRRAGLDAAADRHRAVSRSGAGGRELHQRRPERRRDDPAPGRGLRRDRPSRRRLGGAAVRGGARPEHPRPVSHLRGGAAREGAGDLRLLQPLDRLPRADRERSAPTRSSCPTDTTACRRPMAS